MTISRIKTNSIEDSAITGSKVATGGIATVDMADGSVTSLKIADGGVGTADIANSAVTPAKLSSDAQYMGFKNRIINGAMMVWQRGTSFSGMTPSLGVTAYAADRWFVSQLGSQSATDVTQQTGGLTKYSIRVQKRSGSVGASRNQLGQVIENLNCLDLTSKSITLQFGAKCGANYSATSNNLLVTIYGCTAADQSSGAFINGTATGQSTLYSGNVQLTTSNQSFTIANVSVPANATNICVVFEEASSASAAGANDWFEISDVQLEKGSTATSFDYRPYGTELALCQRYYEIVNGASIPARPQYTIYGYRVTKRAAATLSLFSGSVSGANYVSTNIDGFTCPDGTVATGTSGWAIAASSEL